MKYQGDPRGKHARIYVTLLNSPAWRCLSWSARALFVDLRASLGKANNGDISATLSTLKHRGWTSSTTLARAIYELQALGFLVRTRGGGVESGSKVCSLYAFTDEDVLEFPKHGITAMKASHAYLAFKSVADAEAALQVGVRQLRDQALDRKRTAALRKKTTLQILERDAALSGASTASNAAVSGAVANSSLQKVEQTKSPIAEKNPQGGQQLGSAARQKIARTRLPLTAPETAHLCITARGSGGLASVVGSEGSGRTALSRFRLAEAST